jgi:D-alanyl-D-alanine carboxypeptidase
MRYTLCALILLSALARAEEAPLVNLSARCAVITEAKSGRVLFAKNEEERFPPASTTKIMTAIVALENAPLERKIVPAAGIVRVEPTIAGLKPGVEYSLSDLIDAILVKSANDAAVAIAENLAGSEKEFARMMNRKAEEIGMKNTYFATASGLPTGKKDRQYTTALDLARMMRYALRYERVIRAASMKESEISGADGKKIHLKTHNRALLSKDGSPWGKTGYTREAKRTFVGIDPSFEPKIVFAVLQSEKLWSDITALNEEGIKLFYLRNPLAKMLERAKEYLSCLFNRV